jgi:hypothetical protein
MCCGATLFQLESELSRSYAKQIRMPEAGTRVFLLSLNVTRKKNVNVWQKSAQEVHKKLMITQYNANR